MAAGRASRYHQQLPSKHGSPKPCLTHTPAASPSRPGPPFSKEQSRKEGWRLPCLTPAVRNMRQGGASRQSDWGASCGLHALPAGEQSWVLVLWPHPQRAHYSTQSLKVQLAAGSPLPVPSCWVTIVYLTALRCLQLHGEDLERLTGRSPSTWGRRHQSFKFWTIPSCTRTLHITIWTWHACLNGFSPFPLLLTPLLFISRVSINGGQ